MADWSQTWTYLDGDWHEGNVPIIGPRTHAFWLGSSVFDGARAFEGVTPDLDRHCARVNASARTLGLEPTVDVETMIGLTREGMKRFAPDAALYIRPMYWAEQGGYHVGAGRSGLDALPAHALRDADAAADRLLGHAFALSPAERGIDADRRQGRVPLSEQRARHHGGAGARLRQCADARHARQRGGDRHVERLHGEGRRGDDARRRTARSSPASRGGASIQLLREAGIEVRETALTVEDFLDADEIFSTGNYSKVVPITRIEERELQPGPIQAQARRLYWEWAHA